MQETQFHRLAEQWLNAAADALEEADQAGLLEVDAQNGVLTIELSSKKTFIISKHSPTQQLWLSSPVSGGLHFPYDETKAAWVLADGRKLNDIVAQELATLAQVRVQF